MAPGTSFRTWVEPACPLSRRLRRRRVGDRTQVARRFAVGAFAVFAAAASAVASDPPRVGLAASKNLLWVVHRRAEDDGQLLLHFASRRAERPEDGAFQPLLSSGLQGAAVRIAALGDSLHVIYRDGTHRRYVRPLRPWETAPGKIQHTELVLPRSAVPPALAADQSRSMLLAVLSTRLARDLPIGGGLLAEENKNARLPSTDTARGSPGTGSEPPDSHAGTPSGGMTWPMTDFVVLRFAEGRWAYDRPAPVELTASAEVALLLAQDRVLHLIFRTDREQNEFVAVHSSAPDAPWSTPRALPLTDVPAAWGGGWCDDRPVVLCALRADRRWRVSTLVEQEGRWVAGPNLVAADGEPAWFEAAPALEIFAGKAVVAEERTKPELEVRSGTWSVETGKPLEDPSPVRALRSPPGKTGRPTRLLVEYAVIGTLIALLFLWQRGRVFQLVLLPPGLQLAPIVVRVAAALVDVLLLLPFWSLAFYALWTYEGFTLADLAGGAAAWSAQQSTTRDLFLPLCGAIYALYGTIFEATMLATPGKRIWGLAVLGNDARPGSFVAILVRNVARVVEFEVVPLFVLVGLTPNRQRFGDLLAGTVVVSARAVEPAEPPSTPPESGAP